MKNFEKDVNFENAHIILLVQSIAEDASTSWSTAEELVKGAVTKGFRQDIALAAVKWMAFDLRDDHDMKLRLHHHIFENYRDDVTVLALASNKALNAFLKEKSIEGTKISEARTEEILKNLEF